ncbi:uncharacterized protein ISCGN_024139 [Ixodes scapularis]
MCRPYRAIYFRDGLKDITDMAEVISVDPFQMSHVWMATFASLAATEKVKQAGQLKAKGKKCLVLYPNAKDSKAFHEGLAPIVSELLKWGVLGSLLIGWVEAAQKNETRFKQPAPWTLRDIACLLFSITSSTSAIRKGVYMLQEQSLFKGHCTSMLLDSLAHIATGIGLASLGVISSLRRRRGLGASGFICFVLGMAFTATMVDLLTLHQQLVAKQVIVSILSKSYVARITIFFFMRF